MIGKNESNLEETTEQILFSGPISGFLRDPATRLRESMYG